MKTSRDYTISAVRSIGKFALAVTPYIAAAAVGYFVSPEHAFAATNTPIDEPTNTFFTDIEGYAGPLLKLSCLGVLAGVMTHRPAIWGTAAMGVGSGAALGGLDDIAGTFVTTGGTSITAGELLSSIPGLW